MYRTALTTLFGLLFLAGSVPSADACDNICDPCNPGRGCICHNIGGPEDLGADCDMTGTCTYVFEGQELTLPPNHFLGIIVNFNAENPRALAAHLAHGDGVIKARFDPPLHLASEIGPHRASNVECMAEREVLQPDEPGN
jgi:hypothetical protein